MEYSFNRTEIPKADVVTIGHRVDETAKIVSQVQGKLLDGDLTVPLGDWEAGAYTPGGVVTEDSGIKQLNMATDLRGMEFYAWIDQDGYTRVSLTPDAMPLYSNKALHRLYWATDTDILYLNMSDTWHKIGTLDHTKMKNIGTMSHQILEDYINAHAELIAALDQAITSFTINGTQGEVKILAGTNVTIDTNIETKEITINSTGGGPGPDPTSKYVAMQPERYDVQSEILPETVTDDTWTTLNGIHEAVLNYSTSGWTVSEGKIVQGSNYMETYLGYSKAPLYNRPGDPFHITTVMKITKDYGSLKHFGFELYDNVGRVMCRLCYHTTRFQADIRFSSNSSWIQVGTPLDYPLALDEEVTFEFISDGANIDCLVNGTLIVKWQTETAYQLRPGFMAHQCNAVVMSISYQDMVTKEFVEVPVTDIPMTDTLPLEIFEETITRTYTEAFGAWVQSDGLLTASDVSKTYIIPVKPNTKYTIREEDIANRFCLYEYAKDPSDLATSGTEILGSETLREYTWTTKGTTQFLSFWVNNDGKQSKAFLSFLGAHVEFPNWVPAFDKMDKRIAVIEEELHPPFVQARYFRETMARNTAGNGVTWSEVQIYEAETGRNVARGKTVIANANPSGGNVQNVTDGIIAQGSSYVDFTGGVNARISITIDLEKVCDITHLTIWRWYGENRKYQKVMTELSLDGTTWWPIFDSNAEGEVLETPEGQTIQLAGKRTTVPASYNTLMIETLMQQIEELKARISELENR